MRHFNGFKCEIDCFKCNIFNYYIKCGISAVLNITFQLRFFYSIKILLFLFNFVITVMLSTYTFDVRLSFVICPLSFSHFSSFIIRECIPEFFVYYFRFFLVLVLMIHSFFHSLDKLLHLILLNPSFALLNRSIHLKQFINKSLMKYVISVYCVRCNILTYCVKCDIDCVKYYISSMLYVTSQLNV